MVGVKLALGSGETTVSERKGVDSPGAFVDD